MRLTRGLLLPALILYAVTEVAAQQGLSAQRGPLRLQVVPSDILVGPSATQQFTARLSLFSGVGIREKDVTNGVQWFSADPTIATVNQHTGLVTGGNVSGTQITTITAVSGPFKASVQLTVGTASLTSISIAPSNPSVPLGLSVAFTAVGHYSDGSSHNLTDITTWKVGTPSVAGIDLLGNTNTLSQGSSTISASLAGQAGSTLLSVTAPVLTSITLFPSSASTIFGVPISFTAIGSFTNGDVDLTSTSTWSVNLKEGGNTTFGTICDESIPSCGQAGIYNAPTLVPNPATVNIRATDTNTSITSQQAPVTINHSAGLFWTPSTTLPGQTLVGYNVYRSSTSGGPYVQINPALLTAGGCSSVCAFTDLQVSSGSTYFYVVTSVNSVGLESDNSNEAVAKF